MQAPLLNRAALRAKGYDPYNTVEAPQAHRRLMWMHTGPLTAVAYRSQRGWDFSCLAFAPYSEPLS